ncbi:hypothetical protein C1645_774532 [Glomus cerebriforme]|uniref:Uncharacterized protein n=1 Tax=Glomus cerebriforme TaxID=658196 RepID=A0A397T0P0_9GLOM|nr:hypothetical protein C1645_774532 [Glomus cerebriforme]
MKKIINGSPTKNHNCCSEIVEYLARPELYYKSIKFELSSNIYLKPGPFGAAITIPNGNWTIFHCRHQVSMMDIASF